MTVLVFLIAPAILALGVIALSLVSTSRAPGVSQFVLGVPAVGLAAWALFVLSNIAAGAWPTYLPHLAIAIAVPLSTIQWLMARRR